MKFQRLTIHNLASIEDATIDFESQPLAGSEVFLITGKTGSGKSTILDAICLALYATTPRMKGSHMQGDAPDGNKTIGINDPRQLMRRNTGEAFASLTFTGNNGVHYEAVWYVARAHKKPNGNLQQKSWQLKNIDTNHTLTKEKEITDETKVAIGLDFNQFCRTTLLAQGDFTRFLNSKDEEKAEIMEKITGVDAYSKIGAKIFAITRQKEQEKDEAQRRVEDIHTLTDEEIAQRQEALAALGRQCNELTSSRDKELRKREWIDTEAQLAKELEEASDALREAKKTTESEEFKSKETLIRDWNSTLDARRWMTEINEAQEEQKKQVGILNGLSTEYALLLGGKKHIEQEIKKKQEFIQTVADYLATEGSKAGIYENTQKIVSHLTTIIKGRETIERSNRELAETKKALRDQLIPAYDKAKKEAKEATEALEKDEKAVKQQETAVETLNLVGLRKQRDTTKDLLSNIVLAKDRIASFTHAYAQHESTRGRLTQMKAIIDGKIAQYNQMEAPIHDAEIRMNTCQENLDQQKDTIHKFTSTLRMKLHIGDTCPVCRQKITSELPHEEELSAMVNTLQATYDESVKGYKKLVEERNKLSAEIAAASDIHNKEVKTFNEDKSLVDAENIAIEACKSCGIAQWGDTTLSLLNKLESDTIAACQNIDAGIKQGEEREKRVKELRKALEQKRTLVNTQNETLRKEELAINEYKNNISIAEKLIQTKQVEVDTSLKEASKLITSDQWAIDWKESPKAFADLLNKAAKAYQEKTQQRTNLDYEFKKLSADLENIKSVVCSIIGIMSSWQSAEAPSAIKVDNLLRKANDISQKVAQAHSQLRNAEERYASHSTKLNTYLRENTSMTIERLSDLDSHTSIDITNQDRLLREMRDIATARNTLVENAKRRHAEHQQQKPELSENDNIEILNERIRGYNESLNTLSEQRGAINNELDTDKANKERLGKMIEEINKRNDDYQKWSRLNQLIGDASGNKFRKIAQSYILTSLIHSANNYMKTLSDRYTLKVSPGTFVISIEDAYQGFVSRATSTISGGESFLVSLSLALALSDMGQTFSVDTLFIDEGFGTLSGEPLQNAIDTLRSLHNKVGRHVGIISHVEELQERIPVQIQVNQEGNSSSSTINIVP